MKYLLIILTFASSQAFSQYNQSFDLELSTTDSGMEQICQVSSNGNRSKCLPVATMNEMDLNSMTISESFVKVGHMDLIPLAKKALELQATKVKPMETALLEDSTPQLPAITAIDSQSLQQVVNKFDVLSVRRVATPFSYAEIFSMKEEEILAKYPQLVDEDGQTFRIPVYFNVRWESGVSQGTLQVVAEVSLSLSSETANEDLRLEDVFHPDIIKFSDTETEAKLGRGIERALRARAFTGVSVTGYLINKQKHNTQADAMTLEMLNNVVAPFVGNYLYTMPIGKTLTIGLMHCDPVHRLGGFDLLLLKVVGQLGS